MRLHYIHSGTEISFALCTADALKSTRPESVCLLRYRVKSIYLRLPRYSAQAVGWRGTCITFCCADPLKTAPSTGRPFLLCSALVIGSWLGEGRRRTNSHCYINDFSVAVPHTTGPHKLLPSARIREWFFRGKQLVVGGGKRCKVFAQITTTTVLVPRAFNGYYGLCC